MIMTVKRIGWLRPFLGVSPCGDVPQGIREAPVGGGSVT